MFTAGKLCRLDYKTYVVASTLANTSAKLFPKAAIDNWRHQLSDTAIACLFTKYRGHHFYFHNYLKGLNSCEQVILNDIICDWNMNKLVTYLDIISQFCIWMVEFFWTYQIKFLQQRFIFFPFWSDNILLGNTHALGILICRFIVPILTEF